MDIGFIGLGTMGSRIAANLLEAAQDDACVNNETARIESSNP